ncbi:hypothetical protein GCM10027422_42260 [Hymenobacter arcticus]
MAEDTAPDLNQIYLKQSIFLECHINNAETPHDIWPHQVDGFRQKECKFIPFVKSESNTIGFELQYHSVALDEEKNILPAEGKFRIFISFAVENLSDLLYYDERFEREIPNELVTTSLIGVAYSTARGMILGKVADTVMAGLSLPLRSARELLSETQPTDDEVKAIHAAILAEEEKDSIEKVEKVLPKKRKRASPKK